MKTMRMSKGALLLSLSVVTAVHAFVPLAHPTHHGTVSSKTRRFAVSDMEAPSATKSSTPSTVFGRPLEEATKEANHALVKSIKEFIFDTFFAGDTVDRAFARFYALETIARVPYFSYLSVLHLLESIGLWRRADYLKVHFCESWNELHHLLIMEELGGADQWKDRFVAQHIAFFYYWIVVACYLFNPTLAYNLNQAVEEEAYQTYDNFLTENKGYLEGQPAPQVAQEYYRDGNLYLFDEMHTSATPTSKIEPRRPRMLNLFDAFVAVRDDEMEHVKTMAHMQDEDASDFEARMSQLATSRSTNLDA